jgi:phosphonate transport system substrate-binding protein
MKTYKFIKFICLSLSGLVFACSNSDSSIAYQPAFAADTSNQTVIVMGFPNFSYSESSALLVEYLNAHLSGARIKVHACVDWQEFISFLDKGKFDIILTNGIVASQAAEKGYSIHGKITSDYPYTSLIITQKNSNINKVTDLKGKKVSLVPSSVIPATMMGEYYLYENGLDVNLNIHKESVASFEAGILSVGLGKSDAAICPKRNWNVYLKNHPEILLKAEVKWETPPLEHNAILIKNSVDKKVIAQMMDLFLSMHNAKDAKSALDKLDITGFAKADNATYKPTMDFKKKYDEVIF